MTAETGAPGTTGTNGGALAVVEHGGALALPADALAGRGRLRPGTFGEQLAEAADYARVLAPTAFMPQSLRIFDREQGFDLEATAAQATAAILTGDSLGLGVMASLRAIDIVPPGTGQPALRVVALRAILLANGHDIWVAESTATRALVRGRRAGTDIVQESLWTIDRAKNMPGRNKADSNWNRDPTSQLVARAMGEVAKWVAGDALMGLPYLVEEFIDDLDDEDAPPRRRKSNKPRARPAPRGAAPKTDPAPDPAATPISTGTRTALFAAMGEIGITSRQRAVWLSTVGEWVGRPITSSNDLTEAEAETALGRVAQVKAEQQRAAGRDDDDGDPGPSEPAP